MKKRISKILGVLLTAALLVGLFVTVAPVAAGTQSWSRQSIPSATGLVLDPGNTFTGPFAINSDGTIIYAASDVGGLGSRMVKSLDGGRTWTALALGSATYPITGPAIVDIVCSSIDPNTVYATDGVDIWRSDDGGLTWAPRTNLFAFAATAGWTTVPSGLITSIDVGYLAQGPHIFAGVGLTGNGGVYVCYEWQLGMPWDDMAVDLNRPNPWTAGAVSVLDVKVDPSNFVTTQMIMAVAENTTAGKTYLTHHYDGVQWNSMEAADAELRFYNTNSIASAYRAQIWLPDGFNASLASGLMQYFVGIACWNPLAGDVYWVLGAAVTSTAIDLNIGGPATAIHITGLDGEGGVTTASILASGYSATVTGTPLVLSSQTGGATWTANLKRPTGGTSPLFPGNALSSVLVMPGYASSGTALVGTHGADCGVHITNDFGSSWNGISLLNTSISAINDLEPGSLFMATDDGTVFSIWRYASNWERVFSSTLPLLGGVDMIEASPAGDAVFAGNSTSGSIWRSLDDGQTWLPLLSVNPGGALPSWAILNANTVLVGGAGVVYQTTTNGVVWFTSTCAIGTVQSFAVDPVTGDILAGSASTGAGTVALSQDGGVTWTVSTNTISNIDTTLIVTFGPSYATTGQMFATGTKSADGDAGVWKRTTGSWSQIDRILGNPQSGLDDVNAGIGLVSAPGISGVDMVYAADGSAAGEGVYRIKANRLEGEQMTATTLAATTFAGLWYAPGSNVLWTIGTSILGPAIWTYTDTLAVAGSGVVVSSITPTTCSISWNDLTNALTYLVVVNTTAQTNYYTAVSSGVVAVVVNNTANTAVVTGLAANTTYFVSVWGATRVSSFLFDGAGTEFTTTPTAPAYTINATADEGGTINPSGEVVVGCGADQEFTITPSEGYEIADVLVDGGSVGAVESYLFEDVTADHTISASFQLKTFTITLSAGWNLISLPLIPDDDAIAVVLAGIGDIGNVTSVYYWYNDVTGTGWQIYVPGAGGTLTTMEDGKAYFVFMSGADTLTITGRTMPEPPTVPPIYEVYAGWNFIGFKSLADMPHTTYLTNLVGSYTVIYGYQFGGYHIVFPGDGNMEVGCGYWLWANESGIIVPPLPPA